MCVTIARTCTRLAGAVLTSLGVLLGWSKGQATAVPMQQAGVRVAFSDAEAKAVLHDLAQMHIVQAGLTRFHKVHARWPGSWQDVVAAGLCRRDLYSAAALRIDPGDGSLDFMFDCLYAGADGSGLAVIRYQGQDGRPASMELKPPESYASVLSRLKSSAQGEEGIDPALFDQVSGESASLRLLGLAGVCNDLLLRFKVDYHRYPASIKEFLDSGYAPFGEHAVNPRTGGQLLSDGASEGLWIPLTRSGALTGLTYPVLPSGRFPATNVY